MAQPPKIAIIGGGITGLTAAFTLEQETDFEVALLEAGDRFGGKIQTVRTDGFTVEEGPDSIFAGKPAVLELIGQLELEDEVIEPKSKGYYLLLNDRLHRVPSGLANLGGVDPSTIMEAEFLSKEAKERALAEPSIPPEIVADESIAHFFTRRFGYEFSRLVAEPILAGTHAGDPSKLSMRALYPHYLDREAQFGNLALSGSATGQSKGPSFLSFKSGMATMVEALLKRLKRTSRQVCARTMRFDASEAGVVVWTDGRPLKEEFSQVLLTVPANEAASLFQLGDADTAQLLKEITFASSAIVTVAYDANSLPGELMGTGFLAPYDEDEILTGCTWSSSKWPDRAPGNRVVFRFFYGGDGRPPMPNASNLLESTRAHSKEIMGIDAEPVFTRVQEYPNALPQYTLGHTELVDRIEESLEGTLFTVAGSSFRGVGIPDCIRQGCDAARKIAKELG